MLTTAGNVLFQHELSPLNVVAQATFLADLLLRHAILDRLLFERFLLVTLSDFRQNEEVELPRLPHQFRQVNTHCHQKKLARAKCSILAYWTQLHVID